MKRWVILLLLLLPVIGAAQTLLQEDFEGCTPPNFPSGWAVENSNSDSNSFVVDTSSTYNHTPGGSKMAKYTYNITNAADDWFFTSGLSLSSGTTYRLTFWYRARSSIFPEKLEVKIGDAQSSSNMSTQLWVDSLIDNTSYEQATVNFTVSSDGTYYLGFHCFSDADMWNLYVDDIEVIVAPTTDVAADSMHFPTAPFAVNDAETVRAYISNQTSNATGSFNVYLAVDDSVVSSQSVSLDANEVDSVDLSWTPSSEGDHDLAVYTALSGDQDHSNDTTTATVNVLPEGVLLSEDFSTYDGDAPPPTGWDEAVGDYGSLVDTNSAWTYYSYTYYSSPRAAYLYMTSISTVDTNAWLITPALDLTSNSGPDILEYYIRFSYDFQDSDEVKVMISTDGGSTWNSTPLKTYSGSQTTYTWIHEIVDLGSYNSYNNVKIAFWGDNNPGGSYNYIYLDDVRVRQKPDHDVSVDSLNFITAPFIVSEAETIRAYVYNWGANTETFDVILEVNGSQVSSAPVISLASGASSYVDLTWTPSALGVDTLVVYSDLSTDQNPTNDTISTTVTVATHSDSITYYVWKDMDAAGGPSYNWVEISGTGTMLTPGDDGEVRVALPFTFPYFNHVFDSVTIGSNGGLDFTDNNVSLINTALPSSDQEYFLAPFWDDLRCTDDTLTNGNDSVIYYQAFGTDSFVIQWDSVPRYSSDRYFTFEVILYSNGDIKFQYQDMSDYDPSSENATIGIQDSGATALLKGRAWMEYLNWAEKMRKAEEQYKRTGDASLLNRVRAEEPPYPGSKALGDRYVNYTYDENPFTPNWTGYAIRFYYTPPSVDVGVASIDVPDNTVHAGVAVTPEVTVHNFGQTQETFYTYFVIDSASVEIYRDSAQVTVNAGDNASVTFSSWTPTDSVGITYNLTAFTVLSGDADPGNDTLTSYTTTVVAYDVMPVALFTDPSPALVGQAATVKVSVYNAGAFTESNIPVQVTIPDEGYSSSTTIDSIDPGDTVTVSMPDSWTPSGLGSYDATAVTSMTGDQDNSNDTLDATFYAAVHEGVISYYTWKDMDASGGPSYNWVEISGTGTMLTPGDDGEVRVALPFSFPYFGHTFDSLTIGSNGGLDFTDSDVYYWNTVLPSSSQEYFIAPFWDDLMCTEDTLTNGNDSVIYYQAFGTDSFVIQWDSVPHIFSDRYFTFEVILYPNGNIKFQYQDMSDYDTATSDDATIGIQDSGATTILTGNYLRWAERMRKAEEHYKRTGDASLLNKVRAEEPPYPGSKALGDHYLTYTYDANPWTPNWTGYAIQFYYTPPDTNVGVVSIDVPGATVFAGVSIQPQVTVHNYGVAQETFYTYFIIDSSDVEIYRDSVQVTVDAGDDAVVTFASWTPYDSLGVYYDLIAYTALSNDQDPWNDTLTGYTHTVASHDVAPIELFTVPGTPSPGDAATLKAKVVNYGAYTESSILVTAEIPSESYSSSYTISSIDPGDTAEVTFPDSWTPSAQGSFAATVATSLTGDQVPSNDTLDATLYAAYHEGIDSFGYRWFDIESSNADSAPTFNWVDISTNYDEELVLSDDGSAWIDLPFAFRFYGETFDSVAVGANGGLDFGTDLISYSNDMLPTTDQTYFIAPFWKDFNPTLGGHIYVKAFGFDSLVVMWDSVAEYGDASSRYTFEAILYREGNRIKFQYLDLTAYTDYDEATIGIQDSGAIAVTRFGEVVAQRPAYKKPEKAFAGFAPFNNGLISMKSQGGGRIYGNVPGKISSLKSIGRDFATPLQTRQDSGYYVCYIYNNDPIIPNWTNYAIIFYNTVDSTWQPPQNEVKLSNLRVGEGFVVQVADTVTVSVIAENRGTQAQTFDILLNISDGATTVFSDTVNVAGFASGAIDTFEFADWIVGNTCGTEYDITVWKEPSDEMPSNDTVSTTVRAGLYAYDDGTAVNAYAWYDEENAFGVKFLKPAGTQHTIDTVYMWFWGTDWPIPGSDQAAYYIFDDDSTGGFPGTLLYVDTVTITRGAWNALAPDTQVTVDGSFFVFYMQLDTFPLCPGIGIDAADDAPESTQWYWYGGDFYTDEDPNFYSPGDFLIRVLECPTGGGPSGPAYVRGDANADGAVNVTDAVYSLGHLFPPQFACQRAADASADDALNVSDVLYLLGHLFPLNIPAPKFCGDVDTFNTSLPCDSFPPCGYPLMKVSPANTNSENKTSLIFGSPEFHNGYVDVPVYVESETGVSGIQLELKYTGNYDVSIRSEGCASEEFDYFKAYNDDNTVAFVGVVSLMPTTNGEAVQGMDAGRHRVAVIRVKGNEVPALEVKEVVLSDGYGFSVEPVKILGLEEAVKKPKFFALYQNIPNPFSSNTLIKYAIPKDVDVEIAVYNVVGQRVRTLVNGRQKAGYRAIEWDGRNDAGRRVSPGVYFVKMTAGKFNATRKLTLLR